MRVNIYAEEMTDRVEIVSKEIDGQVFTGLRFYLELPVTPPQQDCPSCHATEKHVHGSGDTPCANAWHTYYVPHIRGPFIHKPGDDDSAAVTFWGKQDLRELLKKALGMLDKHYGQAPKLPENKIKAGRDWKKDRRDLEASLD